MDDEELEEMTDAEMEIYERGYADGALSAWKTLNRLVQSEMRSFGGIVEARKQRDSEDAGVPA